MRSLRLSKESLTELSARELETVGGGESPSYDCYTVPLLQCLSLQCFWYTRDECV